jgi:HD-GYP domain-containing protein (c-di-GMP phosphodiesterase class II)
LLTYANNIELVWQLPGCCAIREKRELVALAHPVDKYETVQDLLEHVESVLPGYGAHAARVGSLVSQLIQGFSSCSTDADALMCAALLHDIGKIRVPKTILDFPGHLSETELAMVQLHASHGSLMLETNSHFADFAKMVRHHHEWWDGHGYPDGLAGQDIPFGSRCIGVADAYDAMTSDRPYRSALTREQANFELLRCRGTQFDPDIVDALMIILSKDTVFSLPAEQN